MERRGGTSPAVQGIPSRRVLASPLNMPIEREEFVAGETHDAVEGRVVEFLSAHSDSAYTAEEIAVAIGHPAGRALVGVNEVDSVYHILQRFAFVSLLDVMAWERKIERRHVHTGVRPETFYAARPAVPGPSGRDGPQANSSM